MIKLINHKHKGSPKQSVCNNSECGDCSHTSEYVDEGILNCKVELVGSLEDIDDLRVMIKKQFEENRQERKETQLLEESMSRQLNDKEKVCNTKKI